MIFPELPKRHQWIEHSRELSNTHTQAPLHSVEEPTGPRALTVEEWLKKRGLAKDPAAEIVPHSEQQPIDWLAKDAWEFYALCVAMIGWCVYWYGIHRGAW